MLEYTLDCNLVNLEFFSTSPSHSGLAMSTASICFGLGHLPLGVMTCPRAYFHIAAGNKAGLNSTSYDRL